MDAKSTEWRAGPNVCRCCLTEGCYKDISTEYFWMGKREVYAEMLSDTLSLSIAYSQSGGPNSNSRLICELCISRLRDASDFKRQVLECEKTFLQHLDAAASSSLSELEVQVDPVDSDVKLERVKQEKPLSDDDDDFVDQCGFDDDDDDLDDEPLTKLASKIPKKESVDLLDLLDNTKATEKRKSTTKTKSVPAKKAKTVKKEAVKAGASKVAAKTEKKKKDVMRPLSMARRNAETIVLNATVYPFRLPDTSIMCVYCCESYTDPKLFRLHMKEDHTLFKVRNAFAHCSYESSLKVDCTEMSCRRCLETFEKIEEVARHLNEKHLAKIDFDYQLGLHPYRFPQDRIMCGNCGLNFPCLRQLSRHMSSHYQNFTCDTCGKSYTTNTSLQQHIRFSHIAGERICRKCKQTFNSLKAKREHTVNSPSCWMYQCCTCQQRFMTWSAKGDHLVEAHGQTRKSYSCPECTQCFTTRNAYRGHFNKTHAKIHFTCAYCGRKFASEKYLEQHTLVHTGIKTFHCNVCSKSFPRKRNLVQHMWVHSDHKRFECRFCKKQFNQRCTYKAHMKSHHPEVSEEKWF